jgi:hypothetical protein
MRWVKRNWKWIVAAAAFAAWVVATPLIFKAVSSLVPSFEKVVEAFALKGFWR